MELQNITDDMVCWLISRCAAISFTVTRLFSFTMTSTAAMASGVTTRCAWPRRGESVTELMPFMNFLVHSYTCCSDRHASPYWTFIRRWISMGFTPSLLKNGWQNSDLFWWMLQAGPPFLHYHCAVLLHSCLVLPPVGHSSNHEYQCYQLTRQSSCVSNFYRTFNVFIWPSLICICMCMCVCVCVCVCTCTLNTCQSCEGSYNIHAQSKAFSNGRLLFLEQTKRQFLLLAIDGVFSHTSNTFHRCSLSLQAAISTPREGLPCLGIKK